MIPRPIRLARGARLAGASAALATLLALPAAAWEVECADNLYCTATVTATSADGREARFKLERGGDPDGAVFVTTGPDEPLSVGLTVEIDVIGLDEAYGVYGDIDKVWGGNEMTFAGPARRPLVENLRRGQTALITVHFGGAVGSVGYEAPLAGLTVALLEFDRRQGRVDRTDAIVAWGGLPADGGPTPAGDDATPVDAAPADDDGGGDDRQGDAHVFDPIYDVADLPADIAAIGADQLGCALEEAIGAFGANVHALEDGGFLWLVSCFNGDVNIESYVVISDDGDGTGATLVSFDAPPGEAPEPRQTIVNPVWDGSAGTLSATLFHSPDYDCGFFEVHRFVPETRSFEIIETRLKSDCDGVLMPPNEFPLEWSAAQLGR